MHLWRTHWFDLGTALALPLAAWLYGHHASLPTIQLILGLSLLTLLLHQVEEYRWPGYFPGMLNAAVYRSPAPDRCTTAAAWASATALTRAWSS